MSNIPQIIQQGAQGITQVLQFQRQMKLKEDQFKQQKTQWEESMQWQQKEMEAKHKSSMEEVKLKELELQGKMLTVQKQQQDVEKGAIGAAWTLAQFRPNDEPEGRSADLRKRYSSRNMDMLKVDIERERSRRADFIRENPMISMGKIGRMSTEAQEEYARYGTEINDMNEELGLRIAAFNRYGSPNLDPAGLTNYQSSYEKTNTSMEVTSTEGLAQMDITGAATDVASVLPKMAQSLAYGGLDEVEKNLPQLDGWIKSTADSTGMAPTEIIDELIKQVGIQGPGVGPSRVGMLLNDLKKGY